MIDLLSIPSDEAERLAYAEGFTMAAQLFNRIDELTRQRDTLVDALEDIAYQADVDIGERFKTQELKDAIRHANHALGSLA